MRTALVHYHEIGLKGRNRGQFERRLESNLRWALRDVPGVEVARVASRVAVRIPRDGEPASMLETIASTPGVAYVADARQVERTPQAIAEAALAEARDAIARLGGSASTFAIDARRSATDHDESSMEMNRRVGEIVRVGTGLAVDLDSPDITVWIAVVQSAAYVWTQRYEGVGGLPVGTSGGVVVLLSSGIDSPVAAWRIMRRGAFLVGVHFSGRPQTTGRSEHYATEIARVLARSGGMERLYTVPFGEVQRRIALVAPDGLRVLLYRRFMVRVAERIAEFEGAKALVTGESLGQVASQTLDNVGVIDAVATLPVLRPLIGSDKREIVAEARAIGTYELSIACDDDCCTLFMPRRPETHALASELEEAEAALDVDALVAEALYGATSESFPTAGKRGRGRG